MKTVADELKKVDKMVYEEGKEMEALHLLETLETSPELDGDEQLRSRYSRVLQHFGITC
ncbi:MAG: hypothetical protein ACFFD4_00310 [Candidatus Odinarchaeota archaeon]